MSKKRIQAAIAAIEAGEPDDEINRLCALAFGWEHHVGGRWDRYWVNKRTHDTHWPPNPYTTSLDAIIAEMPDDYVYAVRPMLCDDDTPGKFYHYGYQAAIWNKGADTRHIAETTKDDPRFETPHRALLLALFRAMEAQANAS